MLTTFRRVMSLGAVLMVMVAWHHAPALASDTEPVRAAQLHRVELRLPGSDQLQEVTYEIVGAYAIFQGDIILGRVDAQGNLLRNDFTPFIHDTTPKAIVTDIGRWSGGIIPFVINANATPGRTNILSAIVHWEQMLPINFVARTSQSDYVEFVRGDSPGACSSWVGRQGGRQEINLAPSGDCSRGALIHEIGHAVGLYHEQSREDRDRHVTIMWDNIASGRAHNFEKHVLLATDIGPYDFNSIMHYGAFAFCKKDGNGACVGPTIVTKPAGIPIGQRSGLSQGDIHGVLRIYNIVKHPRFLADVNGDGKKDIVAFGNDGVYVSLLSGVGFAPPTRWVANYSHNNGRWRVSKHLRLLADVNGDGKEDVVGFGDAGVYVSLSTGSSFAAPSLWSVDYGYNAGGWRITKHPRFLADVNGDGKQDIVAFGDDGVWASFSTGAGFGPASFLIQEYGYNQGWRIEDHPRILGDVNGDGRQDIVGFANNGIYLALSAGTSFGAATFVRADYGYDTGWRVNRHPRVLADVNGDGKQDIVAFGDAGIYSSLADGAGGFGAAAFVLADYGYDTGWRVENHLRVLADINGDGKQDIVGFGDAGIYSSLADGAGGFSAAAFVLADYGYDTGWRVNRHPRVLADRNGDGKQDIVGFGDAGIYSSLADGAGGFSAATFILAEYGYDDGWR